MSHNDSVQNISDLNPNEFEINESMENLNLDEKNENQNMDDENVKKEIISIVNEQNENEKSETEDSSIDLESFSLTERVDYKINKYIDKSLKHLIKDFRKDLLDILEQTDPIQQIVNDYTFSINSEVRRTIRNELIPQNELFFKDDININLESKPVIEIGNESLTPLIKLLKSTRKSLMKNFTQINIELQEMMNKRTNVLKFIMMKMKEQRKEYHRLTKIEQFFFQEKCFSDVKQYLIKQHKDYIVNQLSFLRAKVPEENISLEGCARDIRSISRSANVMNKKIMKSLKELNNSAIDLEDTRVLMSTSLESLTGDLLNYLIEKRQKSLTKMNYNVNKLRFFPRLPIPNYII